MYDRLLKNGKDNNLKEWEKSDQLTNSIEQAASNKGINIEKGLILMGWSLKKI
ncbi:hypothetical protein SDC9_162599 [bioreactor metagenome]|uniref:Uncharacterized protein n=1 Tax=bioreactor metagenome TaxID=1076179 RepID=A0A645FPI3_9ZZZZ